MSSPVSTQPRTVDIHYSVRADVERNLFFKPAKLNGLVLASRHEVLLLLLLLLLFLLLLLLLCQSRSGGWIKTSNLLSTRSRYEAFRQIIAQRLRVDDDAVDLFSVINHHTQPTTGHFV